MPHGKFEFEFLFPPGCHFLIPVLKESPRICRGGIHRVPPGCHARLGWPRFAWRGFRLSSAPAGRRVYQLPAPNGAQGAVHRNSQATPYTPTTKDSGNCLEAPRVYHSVLLSCTQRHRAFSSSPPCLPPTFSRAAGQGHEGVTYVRSFFSKEQ